MDYVARRIGTTDGVVFRKGYFPETAAELDLYAPMLAGLEFFYLRLAPGGFLVLHDYHSPESDRAVSRAATLFFADKPEWVVAVPDRWGSVLIRKV